MIISPILISNKPLIQENVKQAKQLVSKGKMSPDTLKELIRIDPTPTRKFVGWMAKQWTLGNIDNIDVLKSTVEEYNVFLEKGKTKTKDIYQFKTFQDLEKEVDHLNQSGEGTSVRDLEKDYETIVDNEDLLIMVPHTHEASRKLGLSEFSFRDCGDGTKDSAWCTTYKAPNHFNSYYYSQGVTFYYIKVKSEVLLHKLKERFSNRWPQIQVVALAVLDKEVQGQSIDGYDANDSQLSKSEIKDFTSIIGVS